MTELAYAAAAALVGAFVFGALWAAGASLWPAAALAALTALVVGGIVGLLILACAPGSRQ